MRLLLILIFIALSGTVHAQDYWAKSQAGANVDETLATCSDASGNSYITGYFSTSATINGSVESVSGLTDIFVAKTDLNGNDLWVESFGSSNSDRGLDIAVDNAGNVYICGFFKGTINFGNGVTLSAEGGSQDAFLLKLDVSGTPVWARSGGSSSDSDQANGVAVDGSGNIAITGQFSGDAVFGSLGLSSLSNSIDAFFVKYDANGNELWAKKGSGAQADQGVSIGMDNSGAVYAIGQFNGDIEFDNPYANTVQNAMFLVKYNADGSESWVRWAGGTGQSVGTGLSVDGSTVYITGDLNESITFFGEGSGDVLNSNFDHAFFLVAFSSSGSYSWGRSTGSYSPVSSRGIDVRDGDIAVAGWFECTFQELSDEYGEVTFNNIGFKDAYVARYTTSGSFQWARNFGSHSDEMVHDVCLLSDGAELIVGVYNGEVIVPVGDSNVNGMLSVNNTPNDGLTYCGDSNYGNYSYIEGAGDQDGFAIKAIDPNRAPYDFYVHHNLGCDLEIPETCIQHVSDPFGEECPDLLIGCNGFLISAHNQVLAGSPVGYEYNVTWDPSDIGTFVVQNPGEVTATISSADGCYVSSGSVDVDVYPDPDKPPISDNAGVNDMALVPSIIYLCPNQTVDLTGHPASGLEFNWTGPGIDAEEGSALVVNVDEAGWFTFMVTDQNGCSETNFVQVAFHEVPLQLENPQLITGAVNDTVSLCENDFWSVNLFDSAYEGFVDSDDYSWNWSVSSPGTGSSPINGFQPTLNGSGWYTIELEIESEESECLDELYTYTFIDSAYIEIFPIPDVDLFVDGPSFICSGDTFIVHFDFEGELELSFDPIEMYSDSLVLAGAGTYTFTVSAINEFDCGNSQSQSLVVQEVSTPQIFSNSETGVICPNDSVLLISNGLGNAVWQGPNGPFASDTNSVYVFESGSYYIESSYYEGCELVSNTIEIDEYATPYLAGSNAVLCGGDTIEIGVVANGGADIVWLAPLSGTDSIQSVFEPGIYTAEVTSCGIAATISIEVEMNDNELFIEQITEGPVCEGDSILVQGTFGYDSYNWIPQGTDSAVYFYNTGNVFASAIDEYGCLLNSNQIFLNFEITPNEPVFDFDLVCIGEEMVVEVISDHNVWFLDGPYGEVIQDSGMVVIPTFETDTTFYVFLTTEFCEGPLDSLEISPILYPDGPILGSNAPVCTGSQLLIDVLNPTPGLTYHWMTPTGEWDIGNPFSQVMLDMNQQGIYFCYSDNQGCGSDTVSIDVSLFETLEVVLPADTFMCVNDTYYLSPEGDFVDYLWQDGSVNSTFYPDESGTITLVVHDQNGCESADDFVIELVDCSVHIPNVFSPNGDGINDFWVFQIDGVRTFELMVFNRWGTKVFESSNSQVFWDGKNYNNDEDCSEGVYYYILNAVSFEYAPFNITGYVTIIRE